MRWNAIAMNMTGTVRMTSASGAPAPAAAIISPKVAAMEYAGAILADDRMERSTNPRTRARVAGGAMLARGDAATAKLSISLTHGVFCSVWSAFNQIGR